MCCNIIRMIPKWTDRVGWNKRKIINKTTSGNTTCESPVVSSVLGGSSLSLGSRPDRPTICWLFDLAIFSLHDYAQQRRPGLVRPGGLLDANRTAFPHFLLALDNSDKQTDQSTDRTVLYSSFFDVGGHPLPLSAALNMQALSTFLWTSSCWTCHKRWSIKHWTAGRLWRSCDLHTSFLMFFDYSQLSRTTSRPLNQRPLEPIGVNHWLQRPLAHTYKVHSEWCRYKGQTQLRPC